MSRLTQTQSLARAYTAYQVIQPTSHRQRENLPNKSPDKPTTPLLLLRSALISQEAWPHKAPNLRRRAHGSNTQATPAKSLKRRQQGAHPRMGNLSLVSSFVVYNTLLCLNQDTTRPGNRSARHTGTSVGSTHKSHGGWWSWKMPHSVVSPTQVASGLCRPVWFNAEMLKPIYEPLPWIYNSNT